MAELITENLSNITEYPNAFKRQGAFPLDASSVFFGNNVSAATEAAENYAKTKPTAYVGQILTAVGNDGVKVYVIKDTGGELEELGSGAFKAGTGINIDENNVISAQVGSGLGITDNNISVTADDWSFEYDETNQKLNLKVGSTIIAYVEITQQQLTAGDGITIDENNVISVISQKLKAVNHSEENDTTNDIITVKAFVDRTEEVDGKTALEYAQDYATSTAADGEFVVCISGTVSTVEGTATNVTETRKAKLYMVKKDTPVIDNKGTEDTADDRTTTVATLVPVGGNSLTGGDGITIENDVVKAVVGYNSGLTVSSSGLKLALEEGEGVTIEDSLTTGNKVISITPLKQKYEQFNDKTEAESYAASTESYDGEFVVCYSGATESDSLYMIRKSATGVELQAVTDPASLFDLSYTDNQLQLRYNEQPIGSPVTITGGGNGSDDSSVVISSITSSTSYYASVPSDKKVYLKVGCEDNLFNDSTEFTLKYRVSGTRSWSTVNNVTSCILKHIDAEEVPLSAESEITSATGSSTLCVDVTSIINDNTTSNIDIRLTIKKITIDGTSKSVNKVFDYNLIYNNINASYANTEDNIFVKECVEPNKSIRVSCTVYSNTSINNIKNEDGSLSELKGDISLPYSSTGGWTTYRFKFVDSNGFESQEQILHYFCTSSDSNNYTYLGAYISNTRDVIFGSPLNVTVCCVSNSPEANIIETRISAEYNSIDYSESCTTIVSQKDKITIVKTPVRGYTQLNENDDIFDTTQTSYTQSFTIGATIKGESDTFAEFLLNVMFIKSEISYSVISGDNFGFSVDDAISNCYGLIDNYSGSVLTADGRALRTRGNAIFTHEIDFFKTRDFTFEFIFKLSNVLNRTTSFASITSSEGTIIFRATPYVIYVTNNENAVKIEETGIVQGEETNCVGYIQPNTYNHLTIVGRELAGHQVIDMYMNGEIIKSLYVAAADWETNTSSSTLTIGSTDCTVDIYNIRYYTKTLSAKEIQKNVIASCPYGDSKINILNEGLELITPEGSVSNERTEISPVNNYTYTYFDIIYERAIKKYPCILVEGTLPAKKFDNSADRPHGTVTLTRPASTAAGYITAFSFDDTEMNVQGTSSQGYCRKNYKFKLPEINGEKQKYSLRGYIDENNSISYEIGRGTPISTPERTLCYKADYMSSDHANTLNAQLAFNFMDENDENNRSVVDGFRCLLFQIINGKPVFICDGMLNNDKGNSKTFGLEQDADVYDSDGNITNNTVCQKWEFKDNAKPICLFDSYDFFSDDESLNASIESCYPDQGDLKTAGYIPDYDILYFTYRWLHTIQEDSTTGRHTFSNEEKELFEKLFDIQTVFKYYTFVALTGLVDNYAKNLFLRTTIADQFKLFMKSNGSSILSNGEYDTANKFLRQTNIFKSMYDGDGIPDDEDIDFKKTISESTSDGPIWKLDLYDLDSCYGVDNVGKLNIDYSLHPVDQLAEYDIGSYFWKVFTDNYCCGSKDVYNNSEFTKKLSRKELLDSQFNTVDSKMSATVINHDNEYKYLIPALLGHTYTDEHGVTKTEIDKLRTYMHRGSRNAQKKEFIERRFTYLSTLWHLYGELGGYDGSLIFRPQNNPKFINIDVDDNGLPTYGDNTRELLAIKYAQTMPDNIYTTNEGANAMSSSGCFKYNDDGNYYIKQINTNNDTSVAIPNGTKIISVGGLGNYGISGFNKVPANNIIQTLSFSPLLRTTNTDGTDQVEIDSPMYEHGDKTYLSSYYGSDALDCAQFSNLTNLYMNDCHSVSGNGISVNLSTNYELRTFSCTVTDNNNPVDVVSSVTFPTAGALETVALNGSIKDIKINNHPNLKTITHQNHSNIKTIEICNCGTYNAIENLLYDSTANEVRNFDSLASLKINNTNVTIKDENAAAMYEKFITWLLDKKDTLGRPEDAEKPLNGVILDYTSYTNNLPEIANIADLGKYYGVQVKTSSSVAGKDIIVRLYSDDVLLMQGHYADGETWEFDFDKERLVTVNASGDVLYMMDGENIVTDERGVEKSICSCIVNDSAETLIEDIIAGYKQIKVTNTTTTPTTTTTCYKVFEGWSIPPCIVRKSMRTDEAIIVEAKWSKESKYYSTTSGDTKTINSDEGTITTWTGETIETAQDLLFYLNNKNELTTADGNKPTYPDIVIQYDSVNPSYHDEKNSTLNGVITSSETEDVLTTENTYTFSSPLQKDRDWTVVLSAWICPVYKNAHTIRNDDTVDKNLLFSSRGLSVSEEDLAELTLTSQNGDVVTLSKVKSRSIWSDDDRQPSNIVPSYSQYINIEGTAGNYSGGHWLLTHPYDSDVTFIITHAVGDSYCNMFAKHVTVDGDETILVGKTINIALDSLQTIKLSRDKEKYKYKESLSSIRKVSCYPYCVSFKEQKFLCRPSDPAVKISGESQVSQHVLNQIVPFTYRGKYTWGEKITKLETDGLVKHYIDWWKNCLPVCYKSTIDTVALQPLSDSANGSFHAYFSSTLPNSASTAVGRVVYDAGIMNAMTTVPAGIFKPNWDAVTADDNGYKTTKCNYEGSLLVNDNTMSFHYAAYNCTDADIHYHKYYNTVNIKITAELEKNNHNQISIKNYKIESPAWDTNSTLITEGQHVNNSQPVSNVVWGIDDEHGNLIRYVTVNVDGNNNTSWKWDPSTETLTMGNRIHEPAGILLKIGFKDYSTDGGTN